MKKLIFFITFFVLLINARAQVTSESVLTSSQRHKSANMMEWDIVTPTNSVAKYFNWDLSYGVKYKINISADSLFTSDWDSDYAMFILKESTNGVNFINLDTITWYGATEDTSFQFDKTGSYITTLSQSLTLVDSLSVFTLTDSSSDYRYTRYVGVEAKVDSAGGKFLWTDMDITIWLEK